MTVSCKLERGCYDDGKCYYVGAALKICPNAYMTNADRVRAMSDEELAKHLADLGWDCHFCTEHWRLDNEPLLCGEKCDEKCSEHCLDWLQQPAEEADNG